MDIANAWLRTLLILRFLNKLCQMWRFVRRKCDYERSKNFERKVVANVTVQSQHSPGEIEKNPWNCYTGRDLNAVPPKWSLTALTFGTLSQRFWVSLSGLYPATRHGGAWGERRYSSYPFTTTALDWGEWSASRIGRAFIPGERTPGTHWTGGWVGPRAGLDTEDRGKILSPLPGIEPRSPGRPARSQTLYCLS
jgi:hypothetical protein